jgi:hypothetical protein
MNLSFRNALIKKPVELTNFCQLQELPEHPGCHRFREQIALAEIARPSAANRAVLLFPHPPIALMAAKWTPEMKHYDSLPFAAKPTDFRYGVSEVHSTHRMLSTTTTKRRQR